MDSLIDAIYNTPVIDNHAHNLLKASALESHNLLSITSEAEEVALEDAKSSLPHLRAVKHLSGVLQCEPNWETVKTITSQNRLESEEAWARRCFQGIETVLIDDGLDPTDAHPYDWHDRLVPSKCKRIVRIEQVIEDILEEEIAKNHPDSGEFVQSTIKRFEAAIEDAVTDPQVAGFKSIICYRTGLAIPAFNQEDAEGLGTFYTDTPSEDPYLEDEKVNPHIVHLTAQILSKRKSEKPFQFHTGLGDNDMTLDLGNPALLQDFLSSYPTVIVVLLHASYPFTREAGYLATLYKNTYLDIGEVFPHLSQDGQERAVRESLDLCPSEKLLWSTDGHWFPETYLLAMIQVKEAMEVVLTDYVARGALTIPQAVNIVEDIFFHTSNRIYALGLSLKTREPTNPRQLTLQSTNKSTFSQSVQQLEKFLQHNDSVKFLRLQWLDYTATSRARLIPVKQALKMFRNSSFIEISKAVLGLSQLDTFCAPFTATGVHDLIPIFSSLRLSGRAKHATVQCEFRRKDGDELNICPRTVLRQQLEKASTLGMTFLVGFEIEIVFMRRAFDGERLVFGQRPLNNEGAHSWSGTRALHDSSVMDLIEKIVANLEIAEIELQQVHAETAPGQYEFVLGALPPLEAVDTLLAARDIICQAASDADLRATLYPKVFKDSCGTGAHIHISLQPENKWQSFHAGVIDNLPALSALTYANEASYERVVDGVWAGGTWVAWGPQNRETPIRQIEGSHFEIKCVDGLSNPYLCLAGIIGCGLHGIETDKPLTMKPCLKDPSQLSDSERESHGITQRFPKSLASALANFDKSQTLRDALGKEVVETYLTVKGAECKMLKEMDADRRRDWLIERY